MLLSQPLNHSGLNSPAAVASQVYAQYTFSIIEYGLYQFLQYTLRAPPGIYGLSIANLSVTFETAERQRRFALRT